MRNGMRWLGGIPKGLFVAACLILMLQAAASHVLSVPERNLPSPELHRLPLELGHWKASREQTIEANVVAYLKPDDYILRDYVDEAGDASINLFVAYFKSLQNAYGPHSPRVCLPGAGWLVRSSRIASLPVPGRIQGIPVGEYVMEKSSDRLLLLYWYQNDRNIWAEEFQAKLTLLPDLIRYRRSDVSLVRLIAPMRDGDPGKEFADCVAFTKLTFPVLVERFASAK